MRIVGVIPARFGSSRIPGKPLADICGKPMIWWVYQKAISAGEIDEVYVATEDERVMAACERYGMKALMTSANHDTPTSRIYEVSQHIEGDLYVFISGDEPLIDSDAINRVTNLALVSKSKVTNAMTKIKSAPEVIDFTNIKVVANEEGNLLYATRSPLPYPKGGIDFEYMKFVGIGAFTKEALKFYNDTPKGKLERLEECDLMRFVERGINIKMVEVNCQSISVDTPKDLETVIKIISDRSGGVIRKPVIFPSKHYKVVELGGAA